jgi:hypothetical protein
VKYLDYFVSGDVDAIVGFTGESTLPEFVISNMIDVMVRFTIKQERDIWKVVEHSLKNAEKLLRQTAVTVIFKLGDKVEMREIGLHDPPTRVLGVTQFFCGGLTCQTQERELKYSNRTHKEPKKEAIRQYCLRCKEKSRWIKLGEVEWAIPFAGNKKIFWHRYPMTNAQRGLFASNIKTKDQIVI